jgi:hypothetical protein
LEEGETLEKVMKQWLGEKTADMEHEEIINRKKKDAERAKELARRVRLGYI